MTPTPEKAAHAVAMHPQMLMLARWIEIDWRNAEAIADMIDAAALQRLTETKEAA